MADAEPEKKSKGVKGVALPALAVGVILTFLLRWLYPSVEPGQYMTVVALLSLLAGWLINFFTNRQAKGGQP